MILTIIVMCLGILSRKMNTYIPDIIDLFLGDALWVLMIYFMLKFIFIKLPMKNIAVIALLFCFAIEFSQLYHDKIYLHFENIEIVSKVH